MTKPKPMSLPTIKLIHTIIWIVMASAVLYVFYSGISDYITPLSWMCVWLIVIEGFALLIGRGDCPLHIYALQITEQKELNDTYLPPWIFFKGYKIILTIIFLFGLLLMLIK